MIAPGVSVEEVSGLSLSVGTSATAVPAFIGNFYDKKNEKLKGDTYLKISSWLDFTTRSLDAVEIPLAIRVKSSTIEEYQNREDPDYEASSQDEEYGHIYEVPLEDEKFVAYKLIACSFRLYFENGGGPCYLFPLPDPTDAALANLPARIVEHPDISLLCLCNPVDPADEGRTDAAVYAALEPLLSGAQGDHGYFLLADSFDGKTLPSTTASQTAVYYPLLETGYQMGETDKSVTVTGYIDLHNTEEKSYSLAELEPVNPGLHQKIREALDKKHLFQPMRLRASVAVAGAYCRSDRQRGVWKAPANMALNSVTGLYGVETASAVPITVDDALNGTLIESGINAIRYFTGKGFMVWGARTMEKPETPDWLHVSVRRLFNAAERDITQAMRFAMFEPNSQPTWERVSGAINVYLYDLWRQGALSGDRPEEAYFVHVGLNVTMTETDIRGGRMIVKVGMAAVRPAEFIILKFTQNMPS